MRQRLAYLVGARLPERSGPEGVALPRPEYTVFAERNNTPLLDFTFAELSRSRLARDMVKRGKPQIGLAVAAATAAREYDGFLVSGEDVGLPLALILMLRRAKTPIYIITHGSYFGSPKFAGLMRVLRRYKHVHYLCLAESLRGALVDQFQVPATQAHNAAYGVDTRFFETRPVSGTPLIASAGTANRDYRTLIKACEGVAADVKIAADSAWFPSAVDISTDLLPTNIEVRSFGNYSGLRQLYADFSFVVVPLYPARHACGYAVIIEAMAMGKAVIAAKTEASSDFIIEEETGWYFPPGDVEALRSRIAILLDDSELAQRVGRNARRLIEDQYSLEAYCARMERIIASAN